MKTCGSDFVWALLKSRDNFEEQFFLAIVRNCLDEQLEREELRLLHSASFFAAAANISLNGLAEQEHVASPEMERSRIALEWSFMRARDEFYACAGWKRMSPARQDQVNANFLKVLVSMENLAF